MEEQDFDQEDQANELKALGISIMDQFSLEQNVAAEVDEAVLKQSRKQKLMILKRESKESKLEIIKLRNKAADCEHRLSGLRQRVTDPRQYISVEKSLQEINEQLNTLVKRKEYVEGKLTAAAKDETVLDEVDLNLEEGELVDEDEDGSDTLCTLDRETMIREGKMTPFGSLLSTFDSKDNKIRSSESVSSSSISDYSMELYNSSPKPLPSDKKDNILNLKGKKDLSVFDKYLQDQICKQKRHNSETSDKKRKQSTGDAIYGNFKRKKTKMKEFLGSFDDEKDVTNNHSNLKTKLSPLKKSILHPKRHWKERNLGSVTSELESDQNKIPGKILSERVPFVTSEDEHQSDSDYLPSNDDVSEEDVKESVEKNIPVKTDKKTSVKKGKRERKNKILDDGYLENYVKRIKQWKIDRLKDKQMKIIEGEDVDSDEDDDFEKFEGGYKIPISIWNKLYKYQRTCVKWLWELHCQNCGGILGDEMGLGKTVMVISFLIGLSYSGLMDRNLNCKGLGPVLIVCPATVLHQWVREFQKWWPAFRVAILHESGTFHGKKPALINNINKNDGILITSYRGVIDQLKVLLNYDWHYIILDEGHKIRNPEAQITVALKRFQSPHKLILSGSPIQNSLRELWSLFDFIFPGKLGTLQVFLQQFAVPITQGGYANATKLEVQTAFKCATVLRDTINPYLLRRMKIDVKNHLALPDKSEQVLFCGLSEEQRIRYREYLDGKEVNCILSGRLKVFVGLINLRKICNHPDLYDGGPKLFVGEDASGLQPEFQYGYWKRSGKMVVLHSVLKLWKKQSHKVLLFTQSRQMLCILEKFLIDENYEYLKMDGCTSVGSRQSLIDRFNNTSSIFVFLLTTRVGGLGVNLTGADRVLIFDPDWNPSTDTQARERAWRIGQTRNVTIYRLLTAGTIEEKIYHRQIFKQFLTNRVLKDPKQQRFFKTNDLHELFMLNEGESEKTESSAIFAGTGSEIIVRSKSKDKSKNEMKNRSVSRTANVAEEKSLDLNAESDSGYKTDFICKDKTIFDDDNSSSHTTEYAATNEEQTLVEKIIATDTSEDIKICNDNTSSNNECLVEEKIIKTDESELANCEDKNAVLNEGNHLELNFNKKNISISTNNESFLNNDEIPIKKEHADSSHIPINNEEDEKTEKQERMRALAKMLSKKITENKKETVNSSKVKSSLKGKSSKKKLKKSKEKHKGKKFEGERIENLIKKRKYKYSDESNNCESSDVISKSQDDFVLQKLFKNSGVHTALSHDSIVNSGDQDYLLLESEAEKVAKEALKQIRISRAKCYQPQRNSLNKKPSLPKFGSRKSQLVSANSREMKDSSKMDVHATPKMFSGCIRDDEPTEEEFIAPKSKPKINSLDDGASSGVLSSAQLLKRMRERSTVISISHHPLTEQEANSDGTLSTNGENTIYDPDYPSTAVGDINTEIEPELQKHVDLLTDIRNFIAFQSTTNGRASTDEVVNRFRKSIPPDENHIFKALLNQICDFVRESSGQGLWYIKEEFR